MIHDTSLSYEKNMVLQKSTMIGEFQKGETNHEMVMCRQKEVSIKRERMFVFLPLPPPPSLPPLPGVPQLTKVLHPRGLLESDLE
jgi:hypothetical protein